LPSNNCFHFVDTSAEENKDNKEDVRHDQNSDWELVTSTGNSALSSLTVEEASISDNESLASIEMLSDEAIAGLMLEDELIIENSSSVVLSPSILDSAVDCKNDNPSGSGSCNSEAPKSVRDKKEEEIRTEATGSLCSTSSANTLDVEKYSTPLTSPLSPSKAVGGRSPSRSPTRPNSLPLLTKNSPKRSCFTEPYPTAIREKSAVVASTAETASYAEAVTVTDSTDSSGGSSCNNPLSTDSGNKSTLAYAPLQDALESPLTFPPPTYPPPPPPRNVREN